MKVTCFNVGGAPHDDAMSYDQQARAWHHLAAMGTDLALVQEVPEAAIPPWVRDEWTVLHGEVGTEGKTYPWGSVIAARPSLNLRPRPDLIAGSWLGVVYDYVLVGEIDLPDGEPALVASVHSPAKDADALLENLGKVGAISAADLEAIRISPDPAYSTDVIFHALDRVKGERFIIGGDWNNSRLFDTKRRDDRTTATEFFSRAARAGWYECGGDRNEERSWLREGDRPYQLDHLFCDATTGATMTECRVRLDWLSPEISDHAPLVADFTDP